MVLENVGPSAALAIKELASLSIFTQPGFSALVSS